MKLAKRIFVGIVAVALLVSCVALSVSAKSPELPTDNIEDILEYRLYRTYLAEDFESYDDGEYAFKTGYNDSLDKPYFEYIGGKASSTVKNGYLVVENEADAPVGYKMYLESSGDFVTRLVTSFDVMLGDKDAKGGSDVLLQLTLCDYFEDIPLFGINASDDENMTFVYAAYDEKRITYGEEIVEGVTPELGVWYTVDVLYNLVDGEYTISVKTGDKEILSVTETIAKSAGVDSLKIYVDDPDKAGKTKTVFDNVQVYEGTCFRNVFDPENALADLIIAIDAVANDSETPLETKIEIANLYEKLYEGVICNGEILVGDYEVVDGKVYTPVYSTVPTEIEKFDEVVKIVNSAKAYRNMTYADALIEYAGNILDNGSYYSMVEYRDTYAKQYYDMFSAELSELRLLDGMLNDYDEDTTYAEAVIKAKTVYDDAIAVIDEIEDYCIDFVRVIEEDYDTSNTDYSYIIMKYRRLSVMIAKADETYVYSNVNPDTKYPTVADAIAEYEALENKIAEIEANVSVFVPAVAAMDKTEVDAITSEAPYLTKNFTALYENYLTASSVYENGSVHEALDASTYPGLSASIERYEEFGAYIESRIAACNLFVSIVNGAEASTYYTTIKSELAVAAEYLDTNKDKSLEKSDDVDAAIALYYQLVEKLANDEKNADAYLAAVAEIDTTKSYSAIRSAVDAALALKDAGSITGYAGVKEANIKLAEAEAMVSALEGYSATLIETVNALKKAETIAERREYIFLANSVKDKAESSISGVNAAKSELASQISKYNSDVAEANALFASVVESALSVVSSTAPSTGLASATTAVAALMK